MSARFDGDSVVEQEQDFFAKLGFGLGIGDGDAGSAGFQEESRGHAGLAEADYQYAFVVKIHRANSYHGDTETRRKPNS